MFSLLFLYSVSSFCSFSLQRHLFKKSTLPFYYTIFFVLFCWEWSLVKSEITSVYNAHLSGSLRPNQLLLSMGKIPVLRVSLSFLSSCIWLNLVQLTVLCHGFTRDKSEVNICIFYLLQNQVNINLFLSYLTPTKTTLCVVVVLYNNLNWRIIRNHSSVGVYIILCCCSLIKLCRRCLPW